jgi:hypothetical protein
LVLKSVLLQTGGLLSVLPVSAVLLMSPRKTYHSITLPDNDVRGRLDGVNVSWQVLIDFASPVSANDSDLSGNVIWVHD